jgi:putative SOS response-associated peptidase YedK
MCGRFTSTTPPAAVGDTFAVDAVALEDDLQPRWNVAPTQPVLAVAESPVTGARKLGTFRWGLVPPWSPDLSVGSKMINARAETVREKPAYRKALRRRRCIIPADAFYEWKVDEGPPKRPYAIARADGEPLAFAGLWEVWRDPNDADAPRVKTCVIITTDANEKLAQIHHRMPVVLAPPAWDTWLDPENDDVDALCRLLVPAPSDDFVFWRVSPAVNKAANEGPHLIGPVDEDEVVAADLQLDLLDPVIQD